MSPSLHPSLHQTHFRITPISKSDPPDHLQMHAGKLVAILSRSSPRPRRLFFTQFHPSLHQTHFRITPISKSDPSDHLQMHAGKLGFVLVVVDFSSPRFFPCRLDLFLTSSPLLLSLSSRSIASFLLPPCRQDPLFTSSPLLLSLS